MKKFLTLSLAVGLVGMASAVTLQWNANSVAFDGTRFNANTSATLTGYLIALDSFAASYDVTDVFSGEDVGTVLDSKTKTSAVGKMSNYWTIDTDNYANGATFAVLLKYVNPNDNKTYWNLSSGLVTMTSMSADPPVNADNVTASFSYGKGTDGTLTAGGGWVAAVSTPVVPEPGIAAMALLGLGMMLKRRKA